MRKRKILNFGSINIDYVYQVKDFAKAGETIQAFSRYRYLGGKGVNQSIACARAGSEVFHAGKINDKDRWILAELNSENIETQYITNDSNEETGHAIIQVDQNGENSIVLFGGANLKISKEEIDFVLNAFTEDDWIVLQNEISHIDYIIESAHKRKMKIFFNVAPIKNNLQDLPLDRVNFLIFNQIEAQRVTEKNRLEEMISELKKKYPNTSFIITLGSNGCILYHDNTIYREEGRKVKVVDSTGAGDTFVGYFISYLNKHGDTNLALKNANIAASLAIQKNGASSSIPYLNEL